MYAFKVCSFWSCTFLTLYSSEHTCAWESNFFILPCSSHFLAINLFFNGLFPTNVFNKITGITEALKKNAHDQNEQTIHICCINNATTFHQSGFTLLCFVQMFYSFFGHTAVKILCLNCSSINMYDITQVDFNINWKRTYFTTLT